MDNRSIGEDQILDVILRAAIAKGFEQLDRGEYDEWTPELRARLSAGARQMLADGRKPSPLVTGDYPPEMLDAVAAIIRATPEGEPIDHHAVLALVEGPRP